MATSYLKINHEKYGYDVLALFQSFYPEDNWQLVFPGCREQITEKAEEIGFFAELNFEEGDNAPVDIVFLDGNKYRYPGNIGSDRKEGFGNFLYDLLSERTNVKLPWGTLNGVRPTKIAYKGLEEGKSHEEIMDIYLNDRRASKEKARLAIEIAERERRILKPLNLTDGYSLYVGIPFCPTTCLYCSFTSYPYSVYKKEVDNYLDAMIKELKFVAETMGKNPDTVYIGGGTPTTLDEERLERLLSALDDMFNMDRVFEFTVEAGRADSITEEKLAVLKKHKVSRISINPQTFNQETLDFIGRRASVEQFEHVWPIARKLGFDNINMDIILGLPGENEPEVRKTMEMVKLYRPDSLTVHSLAIKRASKLSQWIVKNGKSTINNSDDLMKIASEGARQLNLVPYYLYRQKNMSGNLENVGFSSEGKEGIYNILIMEELQNIVAIGAGTVTKRVFYENGEVRKLTRCENVKEVPMYCEKIDEMIDRKRKLFFD
ncbi:MAG: coproporphyrinogen dehydrogenase HemZ [Lachnospiraceae bacterium]|nr:coproporphyrinogen dehydrogenase HemZ [Lachnospiraceae bacterium]